MILSSFYLRKLETKLLKNRELERLLLSKEIRTEIVFKNAKQNYRTSKIKSILVKPYKNN